MSTVSPVGVIMSVFFLSKKGKHVMSRVTACRVIVSTRNVSPRAVATMIAVSVWSVCLSRTLDPSVWIRRDCLPIPAQTIHLTPRLVVMDRVCSTGMATVRETMDSMAYRVPLRVSRTRHLASQACHWCHQALLPRQDSPARVRPYPQDHPTRHRNRPGHHP